MIKASGTREQIIEQASQLMMRHGINGFSYRDISVPLGVKNAAIHYHFPNKMDLVAALIEKSHDFLRKSTSEFMAYGGPAIPQLEGLFAFALNQCSSGRPICIVGALAVIYDDLPGDIKDCNERFMKDSVNWLTRVLELGRDQGEFTFNGDPRQKAMLILATIQGARQLSRAHGTEILMGMFDQIRIDLGIQT
jgi:AcrR family transcriptional regulator